MIGTAMMMATALLRCRFYGIIAVFRRDSTMSRISVPIEAHILGPFPQSEDGSRRRSGSPRQGRTIA